RNREGGARDHVAWDVATRLVATSTPRYKMAQGLKRPVMGVFRVGIRLASPSNPDTARELEAVVDTGSHYTLVPRTIVEELGIRPTRKMAARLANGIRIVRDMGQAELSYGALSTVTWVVFGNPDD